LAKLLAAVAEFRRAVAWREKSIAARRVSELAALLDRPSGERREIDRVFEVADRLVTEEAIQCEERLTSQHGELAAKLASDREFRAVRTAEARRRFTHRWILYHSDGLRMSNWWTEELVAATKGTPVQLSL
jgi:hypothetical protein